MIELKNGDEELEITDLGNRGVRIGIHNWYDQYCEFTLSTTSEACKVINALEDWLECE